MTGIFKVALSFLIGSIVLANSGCLVNAQQNQSSGKNVSPAERAMLKGIYEVLANACQKGYPGVSVLVSVKDKTWRRAAGFASLEDERPTKAEDVFRLASITKWFTMVMIEDLVIKGKLSHDTKVVEVLSNSQIDGIPHIAEVTIGQLLDHKSGIYSFSNGDDFQRYLSKDDSTHYRAWKLGEYLQFVKNDKHKPQFKPGADTSYCNTGYVLLGKVIEELHGKPYHEALKDVITGPLDMQSTYFEGYEIPRRKAVDSYQIANDYFNQVRGAIKYEQVNNTNVYNLSRGRSFNSWAYAAGAINSNVEDMHKFGEAIRDNKIPTPESWQKVFADGGAIGAAGGSMGITADIFVGTDPPVISVTLANTRLDQYQAHDIRSDYARAVMKYINAIDKKRP